MSDERLLEVTVVPSTVGTMAALTLRELSVLSPVLNFLLIRQLTELQYTRNEMDFRLADPCAGIRSGR